MKFGIRVLYEFGLWRSWLRHRIDVRLVTDVLEAAGFSLIRTEQFHNKGDPKLQYDLQVN
jgi:hypothetical protein